MTIGTMETVTLEQVSALVEMLSPQDQQVLIQQMHKRLDERSAYFDRLEAFIHMCKERAIRPSYAMDSGEELYAIREERGDQL